MGNKQCTCWRQWSGNTPHEAHAPGCPYYAAVDANEFKKCKELGLEVIEDYHHGHGPYFVNQVCAEAIEKLLSRGTVVYTDDGGDAWGITSANYGKPDTHTALLINVRPIVRDTAESLLREFVACCKVDDPKLRWGELLERAKAFLKQ